MTLSPSNPSAFMCNTNYSYQQQDNDTMTSPNNKDIILYKTEFCRNWSELGHCRYGNKCRYAHGEKELRPAPRHTRYKTQICRAYHLDGSCPYGIRCTFVHDPVDDAVIISTAIKKTGRNVVAQPCPISLPPSRRKISCDSSSSSSSSNNSIEYLPAMLNSFQQASNDGTIATIKNHFYYMKQQQPVETICYYSFTCK